jgi:hypothetical protein
MASPQSTARSSSRSARNLFKERHPDGWVLVPTDPGFRNYGRNPYEGYDTSKIPFLFRGEYRQGINPMARVVVIRQGDAATAITLEMPWARNAP